MALLNKEKIAEIIPHRDPFLLIDEVVELEPGVRCVALKHLSADDFWVKGHFPEYPVTPGVLIIEMLAQAGAVCVCSMPEHKGKTAFFAKIDETKFKRQVLPGETLRLEIEMVRLRAGVGVGKAAATVEGETAAVARLTFAFGK